MHAQTWIQTLLHRVTGDNDKGNAETTGSDSALMRGWENGASS